MPRIFDNNEQKLLPTLKAGGEGACCRLLIGMQKLPQQQLEEVLSIIKQDGELDNQTAVRLRKTIAEHFRGQLTIAAPNESHRLFLLSAARSSSDTRASTVSISRALALCVNTS
jgi:hypothetical protein